MGGAISEIAPFRKSFNMNFEIVWQNLPLLAQGALTTAKLVGLSMLFGLAVAVALVLLGSMRFLPFRIFVRAYVILFRGTPLLLQMFFIYYGLAFVPFIRHGFLSFIVHDATASAVTALALNTGAYTSEIIRGAFLAVPRELVEAARSLGMKATAIVLRVSGPLALRYGLSAYGNELTFLVKSTALASTITVLELTGIARRLISQSFAVVEVFLAIGLIYLVFNLVIAGGVKRLQVSLQKHDRPI